MHAKVTVEGVSACKKFVFVLIGQFHSCSPAELIWQILQSCIISPPSLQRFICDGRAATVTNHNSTGKVIFNAQFVLMLKILFDQRPSLVFTAVMAPNLFQRL
jgi:hypothetical protein